MSTSYRYTRISTGLNQWDLDNKILLSAINIALPLVENVRSGIDEFGLPDPTAVLCDFPAPLSAPEIVTLDAVVAAVRGQTAPPFPDDQKQLFVRFDPNGGPAVGYYRSRSIDPGGSFFMPFYMPTSVRQLQQALIWIIPTLTEVGRSARVELFWGADGASIIASSGAQTVIRDYTINTHLLCDFTQAFSAIPPGALASLRLFNLTASQLFWSPGLFLRWY